jgi:hypothetical protein
MNTDPQPDPDTIMNTDPQPCWFQVNFSAFHSTYEVETPLCSARDLEIFQTKEQHQKAVRSKFSMVSAK